MTADDPPDSPPGLVDEWHEQIQGASTRDRVYAVTFQPRDPTRVRDVAERADISKETARDYLQWFAEVGILDQVNESPDTFECNEGYFEWRRIPRLQAQSEDEQLDQLEALTQREREFRERFDVTDPEDVDALNHADYEDPEAVWMGLQEWRTVRRRIRELERVRQLEK